MKQKVHEILEAFLPAMAQIQATDESDEQKKRNAKEWLRSRLDFLVEEADQNQGCAKKTEEHGECPPSEVNSRPWSRLRRA
jgi:hypothetical protein